MEIDDGGALGYWNDVEVPSAISETRWHSCDEMPSSELALCHNPRSSPEFDWDQWLGPPEPSPASLSPARNVFDEQSPTLHGLGNESLERSLVNAQVTCQCQEHSTICLKWAGLVSRAALVCTCCSPKFDQAHDQAQQEYPGIENLVFYGTRCILMRIVDEDEYVWCAADIKKVLMMVLEAFENLSESEQQSLLNQRSGSPKPEEARLEEIE
jgi:hypothetical protein